MTKLTDYDIIRVENEPQLHACFAVRREVFVIEQQVPEDLEIDEYDESPNSARHVLILKSEGPIATGRFIEYKPGWAKLQRIAVMRSARGTGVGRELVLALEDWAAELGFEHAVLDAQTQAQGFYERIGYALASPDVFLDAGIPHVRMTKALRG